MPATSSRNRTAIVAGTSILIALCVTAILFWKSTASKKQSPSAQLAATVSRINQVNAGLPELQIQAKTLMFAVILQKKIPAAAGWCDALNAGKKLWPVTPTNTFLALNSQMAGREWAPGLAGDTVVFFETASAGWNQTGGAELMAQRPDGVAVALADGRALILSRDEAAKLRWTP